MRAALGAVLTLTVASLARAAPTLEIRARAELGVVAARASDGTTLVHVVATDDVGSRLPLVRVVLQPRAARQACGTRSACITRRDGTCEARLRGCDADEVQAFFDGTGDIDGDEVTIAVAGATGTTAVELRPVGGTDLDLDAETLELRVVREGHALAPEHVRITDELGRTVAVRELGTDADTRIEIPTRDLGPPGIGSLVATLVDGAGLEITGRTMVVRQRRSRLQLVLESARDRRLRAELRTSVGPIEHALVSLVCDGCRVRDASTDARGVVRFTLPGDEPFRECVAAFHPNVPGRTAARSSAVRLPRPRASRLVAALPFVTLFAVGITLAWLGRKKRREEAPPAARVEPPRPAVECSAATHLGRSLEDVAIAVLAAEDDSPLADAFLSIDGGEPMRADANGRFELSFRGRSPTELTLGAPSRAPERIRIRIPHRGEFSSVRVRLETTRMHARRAIDLVARAAARNEDEAALLTLREAEVRLAPPTDQAFAADAETRVYGPREPSLEEARALVERGRERAHTSEHPRA